VSKPASQAGPWEVGGVLATLLGCGLLFAVVHLGWEARTGLAFPDHHTPGFLVNALGCWRWLADLPNEVSQALARGDWSGLLLVPQTAFYPPGAFLLSGLAMALFGSTIEVARASQTLFVAGAIAGMGWLGWQVAGPRGAVLLALGLASATWTSEFTRIYCMVPGQMCALAWMLALAVGSEGLTRPGRCVALGAAFGLGMLVKFTVLLLGLPLVAVAAAPRLLSTRASRLGLLLVIVLVDLVGLLTWSGLAQVQDQGPMLGTRQWNGSLVLGAQTLFGGALFLALALGERGRSGRGLLLVAAVCGLVSGPWYFSRMELWDFLFATQHALPAAGSVLRSPVLALDAARTGLTVLTTFYWGALPWLAVGTVALLAWRARWPQAVFLVVAGLAILLIHLVVPLAEPRYFAPFTPVLVVLAFLWAARWRSTFVACVAFMLLAGSLQVTAWNPLVQRAAAAMHLQLTATSELAPRSPSAPSSRGRPLLPLRRVAVAELPFPDPDLLKALPRKARVGCLCFRSPGSADRPEFLLGYLATRVTLLDLTSGPTPRALDDNDVLARNLPRVLLRDEAFLDPLFARLRPVCQTLDDLLLVSTGPIPLEYGVRLGLGSEPRTSRVTVSRITFHLSLYHLGSPQAGLRAGPPRGPAAGAAGGDRARPGAGRSARPPGPPGPARPSSGHDPGSATGPPSPGPGTGLGGNAGSPPPAGFPGWPGGPAGPAPAGSAATASG